MCWFPMWYSRYSGTAAVQQVQQRYSNGTAGTPAVQQTRIGLLYRVLGTEGTPGTPGTAVQHRTAGTADRCGSQGRLPNKEGPAEAEGVDRHALGHAPPNKEGCQIKKARPRPRGSIDTPLVSHLPNKEGCEIKNARPRPRGAIDTPWVGRLPTPGRGRSLRRRWWCPSRRGR